MRSGFRQCLAVAALLVPAFAFAAGELPETRDLERAGLVNGWWARATVDSRQDEIEYLLPDEHHVVAQSRQGLLTCFRADTGRVEWSVLLGGPMVRAFPAVMNEREVIVAVGLNMFSLDKLTGETLWQLRLPNHPSCTPDVDAYQVYVGTVDGSVYAYDLREIRRLFSERKLPAYTHLAQVWRYKTPKEIVSVVSDGTVVNFISQIGSLYGVDAQQRGLRYQLETDAKVVTPLGLGGDSLYLTSRDARMLSINATNGKLRWIFTTGTPIVKQPRVVGNHVYVAPSISGLYSLNATDGAEEWRQPNATEFLAATDSRVYGFDTVGNLVSLDRATGRITSRLSMREFSVHAANELTDRLYLATPTGLIASFHEQGQSLPMFHRNPERSPILPELAPDEPAAAPAEAAAETPAN